MLAGNHGNHENFHPFLLQLTDFHGNEVIYIYILFFLEKKFQNGRFKKSHTFATVYSSKCVTFFLKHAYRRLEINLEVNPIND